MRHESRYELRPLHDAPTVHLYPHFETFIETDPPPFLKGLTTAPRPFIFDATDISTSFNAGDFLKFNLTLLGMAASFYPYARVAVSRMAEHGLGYARHKFRLQQVQALTVQPDQYQAIFDGEKQKMHRTVNAI